jgi:hypothetical protein
MPGDFGFDSLRFGFRRADGVVDANSLEKKAAGMNVFVVSEPLYDICESWAEEPDTEAWTALYPEILSWLIRPN